MLKERSLDLNNKKVQIDNKWENDPFQLYAEQSNKPDVSNCVFENIQKFKVKSNNYNRYRYCCNKVTSPKTDLQKELLKSCTVSIESKRGTIESNDKESL